MRIWLLCHVDRKYQSLYYKHKAYILTISAARADPHIYIISMNSTLLYPINQVEHSALKDRWGGSSLSFFSGTMRTGEYGEEETRDCTDNNRTDSRTGNGRAAAAKANVKYKDTIFRMIFSEPEHLLSLYNAVSGKDYVLYRQ